MLKLGKKEIEQLLGVTPPFQVKNILIDDEELEMLVTIEDTDKPKAGLFTYKSALPSVKWTHSKLGQFDVTIELTPHENTFSSERMATQPSFIGPKDKVYTYGLQRMVKFAVDQNVSSEVLPLFLGTSASLLTTIANDLSDLNHKKVSDKEQPVKTQESTITTLVPNVNDPIWLKIIAKEADIETKSLPLKFLLTRTREMYATNPQNDAVTNHNCIKLHAFFQKNLRTHASEAAQVVEAKELKKTASKNSLQQTMKLDVNHPVWDQMLTGRLDLAGCSVSLSLNLSRLRSKYRTKDQKVKKEVILELIKFITLKKRELRNELEIIKSHVLTMNESPKLKQPLDIHDKIWQLLLEGNVELNSSFYQLNLFIDSLKNKNSTAESIQELHYYMTNNAARMQQEIIEIAGIAAQMKAKEVSYNATTNG